MCVRRRVVCVALLSVVAGLSSCGIPQATGKILKVIGNPDIPVGDATDQPSTIDMMIFEERGANRGDDGQPLPIDVWVFQLSDDGQFMQSDFESLTMDPKGTLKSTYVDMTQVQVTPDQSKPIENIELKKNTTFIGIVGGYVNYRDVNWRTTVQVNAKGETYQLFTAITPTKIITNLHR
ncbi:type VI secretion system lipoprotein TssJ [Martelella mangrovi]|uniref:Type VI secretion system protein VasD n=1 Tax=Martelella mangrovi TaxID=1397477 RepID=A0ABV2ICE4_9HYPH